MFFLGLRVTQDFHSPTRDDDPDDFGNEEQPQDDDELDGPDPDDDSEPDDQTDHEMEDFFDVEEAMEDAGLNDTTCEFFLDFVHKHNLSIKLANSLIKFFKTHDAKQVGVMYDERCSSLQATSGKQLTCPLPACCVAAQ